MTVMSRFSIEHVWSTLCKSLLASKLLEFYIKYNSRLLTHSDKKYCFTAHGDDKTYLSMPAKKIFTAAALLIRERIKFYRILYLKARIIVTDEGFIMH